MPATPVPPLAVIKPHIVLQNEHVIFMVYNADAEVAADHAVALRKLIDDKDTHGLLLWGILTQMASQNMQINAAANAAANQQRPDAASMLKEVTKLMVEIGMPLPGAPAADIRRPGEEG